MSVAGTWQNTAQGAAGPQPAEADILHCAGHGSVERFSRRPTHNLAQGTYASQGSATAIEGKSTASGRPMRTRPRRLNEQVRGSDHDPGNEREHAGKQPDVDDEFRH